MRRVVTTGLSLLALSSGGLAADLPAPQSAPVQTPPAWTGFYTGLNVGGGFGASRNTFSIAGFELPSFDTSPDGVIGGAQAGYNWQTGPLVLGLEANFEGSGLAAAARRPAFRLSAGCWRRATRSSSPGLERCGREFGYALGSWLLYATGGGALGQLDTNATAATGSFFAADNRKATRDGWTLGGGVEVELATHWTAKVEYLYLDLGSRTTMFLLSPAISNASRLTANVITAGVNYRF